MYKSFYECLLPFFGDIEVRRKAYIIFTLRIVKSPLPLTKIQKHLPIQLLQSIYSIFILFYDKLGMTDTDSLICLVKRTEEQLLKDLETLKNDFDYSNLVPTHPLFDTCSTNKLLKWK